MENVSKPKTFSNIIWWIISAIFLMSGFVLCDLSLISGLLVIVLSITLSPPLAEKIKEKLKFRFVRIVSFILIFLFIGIGTPESSLEDQPVDPNVSQVSTQKSTNLSTGQKFAQDMIGKKVPYEKWGTLGSPETLDGTDNLRWVVYLDKGNISFVSNKQTDIVLYAGIGKNAAIDYIKKEDEKINNQFSSWDGSHKNLVTLIKQNMNDPSSFEHVETKYTKQPDGLIIYMKYRGNNAYGGKVLANVSAKVDMEGSVVNIIDAN